jgi:hypothetical protein
MKKKITLFFVMFSFVLLNAQVTETSASETTISAAANLAPEGTFQFVSKSKLREVFTTERFNEIRAFVELNRHENEERIMEISQYTKVRIASKQAVQSENFHPFYTLFQE